MRWSGVDRPGVRRAQRAGVMQWRSARVQHSVQQTREGRTTVPPIRHRSERAHDRQPSAPRRDTEQAMRDSVEQEQCDRRSVITRLRCAPDSPPAPLADLLRCCLHRSRLPASLPLPAARSAPLLFALAHAKSVVIARGRSHWTVSRADRTAAVTAPEHGGCCLTHTPPRSPLPLSRCCVDIVCPSCASSSVSSTSSYPRNYA